MYWSQRLAEMGPRVRVSMGAKLQNPERISVGADSFVSHDAYLFGNTAAPNLLKIGARTVIREGAYLTATDGHITIGDDCFIGPGCVVYGNGGVEIGDHVLMAANTTIASLNHRFGESAQPIATQGLALKPVVIEDDVWIGLNVTIVPGVRIGRGSVIAAGSVVHADVPPYSKVTSAKQRIAPRSTTNASKMELHHEC